MIIDIIRKDLKLILRSTTSTIAILLAPVLIILLVGLAFSSSGTLRLAVGVVNKDLAPAYAARLDTAFETYPFMQTAQCEEYVQRGILNACVDFGNDSATILVDPSNIQLVASVQGAVEGTLAEQARSEGRASADEVLSSVIKSRYKLEQDAALLAQIAGQAAALEQTLEGSGTSTDFDSGSVDDALSRVNGIVSRADDLSELAKQALDDYRQYARGKETDQAALDDLEADLDKLEASMAQIEEDNAMAAKQVQSVLSAAAASVEQSGQQAEQLAQQAASAKAQSKALTQSLSQAAASLTANAAQLGTVRVKEGDIVNPIAIDVAPVTREKDNFGFVFQFFFVLIIMFSSILLASSIVVRERTSRAYVRNAASPTPDYVFATATFVSVLLIILFQVFVLLLASLFLTDVNILANIGTSLVVIILVAAIFTLIGMAIGYLLRTQEASIVGSITATSIFLLLSPIILPLETLPAVFRFLANANPFVIGAELLKNAVLFRFSLLALPKVGALLIYGGILAGMIFVLQRFTAGMVLERKTASTIADFVAGLDMPEEKHLRLGQRIIKSREQLVHALRLMDDDEFEQYVTVYTNPIADWVLDVYKDHKLADNLRNKNRLGHIHYLERK